MNTLHNPDDRDQTTQVNPLVFAARSRLWDHMAAAWLAAGDTTRGNLALARADAAMDECQRLWDEQHGGPR